MVPRPRLRRRVRFNPEVTYFKPAGVPLKQLEEVTLSYDELESLRLKNTLNLDQKKLLKRCKYLSQLFTGYFYQQGKK